MRAVFRAEGMRKSYGGVRALDGATVEAPLGSVHALLGENGAGKSTLSKILSGVVAADAGHVELGGASLSLGSPLRARAAGIRTAFQELALVPDLTVAQNLVIHDPPSSLSRRLRKGAALRQARDLLDRTGLDEIIRIDVSVPVRTLGLVERHLLEVARALALPPKVLIFDEATSALPATESRWVLAKAREAARNGAVVLFISHRLQEVREVADGVTIMRAGRTVAAGAMRDFDDDRLIAEMLGRRIERLYPARRASTTASTKLRVKRVTVEPGVGPISIDVRGGEILGLGGLEGQGQREFMLALAGVVDSRGAMTLDEGRYRPRNPADALARGVAFVPEDRQLEGLFMSKAARWNLSIGALTRIGLRFGVINRSLERRLVAAQAARLNLPGERLGLPVGALSGGNQQKVILGRVVLGEPSILLLYDCTRGVDVGAKAEIYELMAQHADRGAAVVYYSSDMTETVNMCDRVAVFVEGTVAALLGGAALSEDAILRLSVGRPDERARGIAA